MRLEDCVVALHRALEQAGIPHAFGGAIALAYFTDDPRGTSDIDINVFVDAAAPERVLDALPDGVDVPADTEKRIVRDGQVRLWWGETPVDLFFDNVPIHTEAARHAREVPFEDERIRILGPVELAVFKAMFNRTQDWADIEAMLRAERLDLDAARGALAELVGSDDERSARLDEAVRQADR